jgi:GntR family galactonate operon transcriptional repressor
LSLPTVTRFTCDALDLDRWQTLDPDVLLWRVESGADDDEFLSDLDEFRSAVEPMTARLAAMRADDADLNRLADAFAAMAASVDDDEAFFQSDVKFHGLLIAATHNMLFIGLREAVQTALRVRHSSAASVEHDNAPSVPYHRAVLDAVVARDAATAEQAMLSLLAISSLGSRVAGQQADPGSRAAT